MDQCHKIMILISAVLLAGCEKKAETLTVPVTQKCVYPPVPQACQQIVPQLADLPMSAFEKKTLASFPQMPPQQQADLLSRYSGRIITLLKASAKTRQAYGDLKDAHKICGNYSRRVVKICQ